MKCPFCNHPDCEKHPTDYLIEEGHTVLVNTYSCLICGHIWLPSGEEQKIDDWVKLKPNV